MNLIKKERVQVKFQKLQDKLISPSFRFVPWSWRGTVRPARRWWEMSGCCGQSLITTGWRDHHDHDEGGGSLLKSSKLVKKQICRFSFRKGNIKIFHKMCETACFYTFPFSPWTKKSVMNAIRELQTHTGLKCTNFWCCSINQVAKEATL